VLKIIVALIVYLSYLIDPFAELMNKKGLAVHHNLNMVIKHLLALLK
jgi:hypothetical protein